MGRKASPNKNDFSTQLEEQEKNIVLLKKEIQIEAALEKVRARTMAMHQSEELGDVVKVLYQEFKVLGMADWGCAIMIFDKEANQIEYWVSEATNSDLSRFYVKGQENSVYQKLWKHWEKQGESLNLHHTDEFKKEFDTYWLNETDFKRLPEVVKESVYADREIFLTFSTMQYGMLNATGKTKLSEGQIKVLERFAKVFEQTYTRFLDLQKAEEQAREARIETALEKIRSNMMAMHQSDQLRQVVATMFEQLQNLGFDSSASIIHIYNHDLSAEQWMAGFLHGELPKSYHIPYCDHPYFTEEVSGWQAGLPFHELIFEGPQKVEYGKWMIEHSDYKFLPAEFHQEMLSPERIYISNAHMKYGLVEVWGAEPLPEKSINILIRFAKVFEQTYTRFLDLQKAEEQAREAQIEASMERVRARAMAMHTTGELNELVALIYDEIQKLGLFDYGCSIIICDEANKVLQFWYAEINQLQSFRCYNVPINSQPVVQEQYQSWKKGLTQFDIEIRGKEHKEYIEFLLTETDHKELPEEVKEGWRSFSEVFFTYSNFNYGLLEFVDVKPIDKNNYPIYQRFAKVFEQTYTRFLDLQKAEEQAREAEIQLALERVRARTMAMHRSEELGEVAILLYKEFNALKMGDFFNCGFVIINEADSVQNGWMTQPEGTFIEELDLPYPGDDILQKRMKAWKKNVPVFCQMVSGEKLKKHFKYVNVKYVNERSKSTNQINTITPFMPDPCYFYCGNFKEGYLHIVAKEELVPEAEAILSRFTKVFSQTYTRFLDLQKAEAQAREAQIETALEKVRSRTMAMHSSQELGEAVDTLLKQFKILGFDAISSWVSLMNPEESTIEFWTKHEEKLVAGQTVHISELINFEKEMESWEKGEESIHLSMPFKLAKLELKKIFGIELVGAVSDTFYLLQLRHKYGFLGLGTLKESNEEIRQTVQRFAKVFEQTYTRFLDLQRAEAQTREAKIEASLERVRGASMAMHKSEELIHVANVMNQELQKLGFANALQASFILIDEEKEVQYLWGAQTDSQLVEYLTLPLLGDDVLQKRYDAWKRKEPVLSVTLTGEKRIRHLEVAMPLENINEKQKQGRAVIPDPFIICCGFFKYGYLCIISTDTLAEDQQKILARMAKVFEQTYTRFLDLQKAEAQAREAQIEAGLERVRSASLAMHQTSELGDVVKILFEQFFGLGLDFYQVWINIFKLDEGISNCWFSPVEGVFDEPYTAVIPLNPFEDSFIKSWRAGEEFSYLSWQGRKEVDQIATELSKITGHPSFKQIQQKKKMERMEILDCNHKYGVLAMAKNEDFTVEDHKILKRFTKAFEQAFTRFLDLQKAEEQAREAQIEAALERVRSRSMAMHHSQEMAEIAQLLFQQMKLLGIDPWACGLHIMDADSPTGLCYMSSPGGKYLSEPYAWKYEDEVTSALYASWKKEESMLVIDLKGQDLLNHTEYLARETEAPTEAFIEEEKSLGYSYDRLVLNYGNFKHGSLVISTRDRLEDPQLVTRFAKIFEQTYTRFLDLQKAEKQAKEAQIETALEKVRSRTMAMQKSEELLDLVKKIYLEIEPFGVSTTGITIALFREEENAIENWFADNLHSDLLQSYKVVGQKNKVFKQIWEDWKNKNPQRKVYLEGSDKRGYDNYILTETDYRQLPEELKEEIHSHKTVCFTFTYFKYGYFESVDLTIPAEENAKILLRFAKVFEQTYTRFLDLQKAEAQAREAEIQLALERVRARALAMHQSQELAEVVALMYGQIQSLGFTDWGCAIIICDEEAEVMYYWYADINMSHLPDYFKVPLTNKTIKKTWELWKQGTPQFIIELHDEKMAEYVDFMLEETDHKNLPQEVKDGWRSEKNLYFSYSNIKYGLLEFTEVVPFKEENFTIYRRFAQVFEQTYTRFLDLQKAEAQTREAQIEASMERIRSRSLAMRTSDEIKDVMVEIRRQIDSLGQLDLEASVVHLYEKGNPMFESIAAIRPPGESGNIVLANVFFPVDGTDRIKDMMDYYWSDTREYTLEFDKEMAEEWQQVMLTYAPMIAERRVGFVENRRISDYAEYWNFADFSEGSLLLVTHSPASEDTKTVLRKASQVFDLAYRRYRDLQKAEARAKEAIRQASLDRVRGEIASMRSTEDLNRITPLIWNELTALGVSFIRCGVFIIDEKSELVDVYLSAPDGKSLGVMKLSFNSNDLTNNTVMAWKKDRVYHQFWDRDAFINWTNSLVSQGFISDKEKYQGNQEAPAALNLNFIPFTQGMLYVGTAEELPNSEVELVKSLAKAFALAYSRYEDFVKLEMAKSEIESTLSELKATQAQLIQSEKMASLGELTAGIAHEIQNPLNFVNNFSEVSTELIDEMREELEKGNSDDAKEIANDLKQNLEKITHHGKRAGDIVKGMLQHSRVGSGKKEPTDINALSDEYLRLAFHGLRAKDKSFNATMETHFDPTLPKVNVIPQDIGRVLLNLINNAFYAVNERSKNGETGYKPNVSVSTKWAVSPLEAGAVSPLGAGAGSPLGAGGSERKWLQITISDNGSGIPDAIKEKIFQPFFTTKPTGQGTGLGLSLSYDIVKAHGGELKVESTEGYGTEFKIQLPVGGIWD